MKYTKRIKIQYLCMLFACAGSLLTSCTEEIEIGSVDDGRYESGEGVLAYLSDQDGKRKFTNVEFRSQGETSLAVKTTQSVSKDCSITVEYDLSALEEYNTENESDYEAFPKELVTFSNNGSFTLAAGKQKSSEVEVIYESNGTLDVDKSYIIPLRLKVTSGDITISQEDAVRLIFVKDFTGIPDCNKASGVKIFSCMEVNDTNPLNNLSFTLASNGKPLVDALILFSGNINYNAATGRVYIYNNENVQALLDNRKHYLKPLQDRGMKIILGIMGNHDGSGIANLSDETARGFAQEVKAVCDAYQLDGIFLDDEWSEYEKVYGVPGFVEPSSAAAARLCYEIKKAQPDKLIVPFVYGEVGYLPAVEGVPSGEFVDYALTNYFGASDLSNNYPGLPRANMSMCSQELNIGYVSSEEEMKQAREDGYLCNMIFAMDPNRDNFEELQLPAMQRLARAYFDDELVFDGKKYPKDWK